MVDGTLAATPESQKNSPADPGRAEPGAPAIELGTGWEGTSRALNSIHVAEKELGAPGQMTTWTGGVSRMIPGITPDLAAPGAVKAGP
jgi:hypothetical protein